MNIDVPEALVRYLSLTMGATAQTWLDGLPEKVEDLSRRWSLTDLAVHPSANRSLLMRGRRDGAPVSLKIDPFSTQSVMVAMSEFERRGIGPAVLESSVADQALLIEWVDGPTAVGLPEHAVRYLSKALAVSGSADGLPMAANQAGSMTLTAIERAPWMESRLTKDLRWIGFLSGDAVLHGDLVLKNVLYSGGRAVLIDPEPTVGAVEADIGKLALRTGRPHEAMRWALEANPALDAELLGWVICWQARTYVAYRHALGWVIPGWALSLIDRERI